MRFGEEMYLDIGLVLLICIFGIVGFAKGLLSQVIALVAFCGAFGGAFLAHHWVADVLYKWLTSTFSRFNLTFLIVQFASFIILQVIIYFTIASFLELIKKKVINAFSLKLSDRVFGLFGGVVFGMVLVLFVVVGINWTKLVVHKKASPQGFARYEELLDESQMYASGITVIGWLQKEWPQLKQITPEQFQTKDPVEGESQDLQGEQPAAPVSAEQEVVQPG